MKLRIQILLLFSLALCHSTHAQPFEINSPTDLATIIRQASQNESGFSSPMIDAETARSMSYDNRVKKARTYYERKLLTGRMRDQIDQERLERTQRNAAARRRRQELTRRKDPAPLNSKQINRTTGGIDWPVVLKEATFDQQRKDVDALYPRHIASGGGVNTIEYGHLQNNLKKMKSLLSKNKRSYQAEQYTYARKFLESLMFEIRYPNGRGA